MKPKTNDSPSKITKLIENYDSAGLHDDFSEQYKSQDSVQKFLPIMQCQRWQAVFRLW